MSNCFIFSGEKVDKNAVGFNIILNLLISSSPFWIYSLDIYITIYIIDEFIAICPSIELDFLYNWLRPIYTRFSILHVFFDDIFRHQALRNLAFIEPLSSHLKQWRDWNLIVWYKLNTHVCGRRISLRITNMGEYLFPLLACLHRQSNLWPAPVLFGWMFSYSW